jgi:hypothetical protein
MCDAQIITGLGIMTSGYVLLLQGSLSAYHWQIIIYLAWFSNLTHQAALLFLRGYLRKHPRERLWRFCLMTVLVVMMVVALVPTVFFNWNEPQCFSTSGYYLSEDAMTCLNCSSAAYPAAPARCFYDYATTINLRDTPSLCQRSPYASSQPDIEPVDLAGSTALQSAIVSIVVLVLSYTLRAIRLFEVLSSILQHQVRSSLARVCRNGVAVVISWELPCRMLGGTLWSLMVLRPVLAFYIFGRLLIGFLFSTFADVCTSPLLSLLAPCDDCGLIVATQICWLVISASIGTIRLLRSIGLDDEGEKVWTFGQVMSIFLLLGPILMLAMGLVHPESNSDRYEQRDRLMHESGSTHASGDDHVRGIEMENVPFMTRAPECEAAMPAHFYTTDHLKFTDEINRLFTRDYYNEHVWIVPAVFAMIIVPTQILSLLAIGLIRNHSLANVSLSFVIPVLTCPGILHMMVTFGLLLEGWRYEFEMTFLGLVVAYACAIIPLLGPAGAFWGADENSLFAQPLLSAIFAVSYGPIVLYLIFCPLGLWIWRCISHMTNPWHREGEVSLIRHAAI